MTTVFLLVLFTYGGARLLETFKKRNKMPGRIVASYTLFLLVGAHGAVFLVALLDTRNVGALTATNFVGLVMVVGATFGRCCSIKALGAYHSIQIEIWENHPVISRGPYFFIRNPYYLSNAIEVVGFPLMVSSFFGASVAVLFYWPCLYLRVVLEERALLEAIKGPFSDYMHRVPRFVPNRTSLGVCI